MNSDIQAFLQFVRCSNKSSKDALCSTLTRQIHLQYVRALIGLSLTTESAINFITLHSITDCLTYQSIINCQDQEGQHTVPSHQHCTPCCRSKTDICQRWDMFLRGGIVEQLLTRCSDNHLPSSVSKTTELLFLLQETENSSC